MACRVGRLVGSAASGPRLLVLDKSYQDIILKFAFQCDGCDAGVMLRNVASTTGKRWFSHGMEYPENDRDDPAVMAWFKLVRRSGGQVEFVPHIINDYVGLGTQIAVVDMNGDKRPDVLTAARKGAYIFLNGAKSTQVTSTG